MGRDARVREGQGQEAGGTLCKMMKEHHVSGKIKAIFGNKPGETIIQEAKDNEASLIVMGTRGLGNIRRTILGSVSDFVLHHAHCPVTICRH